MQHIKKRQIVLFSNWCLVYRKSDTLLNVAYLLAFPKLLLKNWSKIMTLVTILLNWPH